jgi:lysophospholipase L1-like esterase
MLNAYHVPAAEGWVSCSSKSSSDNVLDPRITKGAGWAGGGTGTGPGQGGGMQWVSGTGAMSFTPGYQFDTISLFYVTFGNKGTVTVNVNGGASLGSVNANAAAGLAVSTFTTTLGTGTINVTAPTGGDFQLLAFRAYDSTRKSVLVSNFGVDASTSGDWANSSAAFSSLNTWDKLTPDLSIILHSTNDAGNTVPVNTYTANMTTLIDKAATYGSVIVGTETPDNDSEPNYVNFEALYQPALKTRAETKGIPYLNLTKRYASETAGRTLGFIHTDRVHLTPKGSADVASAVYKAITV